MQSASPNHNHDAASLEMRHGLSCLNFVMHPALALLGQARELALEAVGNLESDLAWAFAPRIAELLSAGLAEGQLRLLMIKGYVACRSELDESRAGAERARNSGTPLVAVEPNALLPTSFLMLTPAGVKALTAMVEAWHHDGAIHLQQSFSISPVAGAIFPASRSASNSDRGPTSLPIDDYLPSTTVPRVKPRYDTDLRELWLGEKLVKRYRTPAKNQELILQVFQEENWPARIDDPLVPLDEIDCKLRLRDTITALNRHQVTCLIRFHGDGTGNGVCWNVR